MGTMPSETSVATTGKMAEPPRTRTGGENAAALAATAHVTEKTAEKKPATARKSPAKGSSSRKAAAKSSAGPKAGARPVKSGATSRKKPATAAKGKTAAKAGAGPEARGSKAKTGSARASKSAGKAAAPRAPKATDPAGPAAPAAPASPPPPPELPEGYMPNGDEEYMGSLQTEYFRRKLIDWRQALLDESEQTLESMRDQQREVSDEAERASRETEMSFELRTRDRYRKLIRKINEALDRIEDGSYGFCEETGDPIGLGRLEARPIATLSVEAQERREMLERQSSAPVPRPAPYRPPSVTTKDLHRRSAEARTRALRVGDSRRAK